MHCNVYTVLYCSQCLCSNRGLSPTKWKLRGEQGARLETVRDLWGGRNRKSSKIRKRAGRRDYRWICDFALSKNAFVTSPSPCVCLKPSLLPAVPVYKVTSLWRCVQSVTAVICFCSQTSGPHIHLRWSSRVAFLLVLGHQHKVFYASTVALLSRETVCFDKGASRLKISAGEVWNAVQQWP